MDEDKKWNMGGGAWGVGGFVCQKESYVTKLFQLTGLGGSTHCFKK